MNIKQGKRGGSRHLYNSIRYVLNPKKTGDGILVGGNVGTEPQEVYRAMLDTKEDWGKPDGRQGYHFVISFKPGETDEQTAYDVVKEFSEEYLGDKFDYVFSIHNDHKHMHGHIVFNSVNREDGYKYRYENGDWEKYIQPITDKICIRHDLSPLEFDKGKRKGRSYAQWEAEKDGKPNWKKIIHADIDYAVGQTENEGQFLGLMKSMGYKIRKGESRKHGTYFTFLAPGQTRGWRSYNLGQGYTYEDIQPRIRKEQYTSVYPRSPKIKRCVVGRMSVKNYIPEFQKKRIRKIYFITYRRWNADNPYAVDQRALRKSLLHIDRLYEDINYLIQSGIQSYDALLQREQEVLYAEKSLNNQKYSTEFLQEDDKYQEYLRLKAELKKMPEWDDRFEEILDRMEELEKSLPDAVYKESEKTTEVSDALQKVRAEKRIIRHIKKEEQEDQLMMTSWRSISVPNFGTKEQKKHKGENRAWQKK